MFFLPWKIYVQQKQDVAGIVHIPLNAKYKFGNEAVKPNEIISWIIRAENPNSLGFWLITSSSFSHFSSSVLNWVSGL